LAFLQRLRDCSGCGAPVLWSCADKLGGAKVALGSVFVEAAGLALTWLASTPAVAAAGAALTALATLWFIRGSALKPYAARRRKSRGLAMGAYTVFLDVALGFGSPVLGLTAGCLDSAPCSLPVPSSCLVRPGSRPGCFMQHRVGPHENRKTHRRSP